MPKGNKSAGGRPAKNYDPRYATRAGASRSARQDRDFRRPGEASAGTAGSRSPKHRGHRPEQDGAPKKRWTAQEKAGRDEARGIRTHSDHRATGGRGDGAPRQDRGYRDDRARRQDRGYREDRAPRQNRGYRDDRAPRGYGDDRPRRDDRPSRDDRAPRTYGDRASRSYEERAPQRDRAPRRDDRAPREDRGSYGDRPRRDDRPYRDDSAPRAYADRAPRRDDRGSYGDRPRRDDRPARDDRAPRSFDDRAPRQDRGDFARPHRDDRARGYRDDRPARDDRPRGTRPDWSPRPDRAPRHDRGAAPRADREQRPETQDVVHERLQADTIEATTSADIGFADLGLGQNIVGALSELGAQHPFPIQAATIPAILEGRDVLGRGRTGSGKTIAFGAPLVESILRGNAGKKRAFGRSPQALVLAPTRELALQIDRTIQPIARSVGLFTTQIYGGVPQARQVGALKKGVDIIIGTPGRIEDLQEQGKLDLSEVRIVVLDEADHMSELGFLEPMQRILRLVAPGAQKLLFSATLDREVAALADEFLVDPASYEVAGETQDTGTIEHRVLVIDHRDKSEILRDLVDREGKTLVFSRTRAYAEQLADQFDEAGIPAVALHGDLNQNGRTRNLRQLENGRVNVLVATDVAARGIHVDDIDLVIQADAPDEFKAYLHRSGRTGRAGRTGRVVTLVTRQRRRRMSELLERADIVAPFDEVRPGDDVLAEVSGRQVDPTA